jgi:hypothetical protein
VHGCVQITLLSQWLEAARLGIVNWGTLLGPLGTLMSLWLAG